MYSVSDLWRTLIVKDGHWFEASLIIDGSPSRVERDKIWSLKTHSVAFAQRTPGVGACLSSELDASITRPTWSVPKMAKVRPYIRVTDGVDYSEWVPQGVYYIDTREHTKNDDGLNLMNFHCYDGMLKAEQDYPETSISWPAKDADVIREVAGFLGVGVDQRTWDIVNKNYEIGLPVGYSLRETLGNIGAMYAGNWVMNYDGDLLLIALGNIIKETNYLITESNQVIVFGGDRILV